MQAYGRPTRQAVTGVLLIIANETVYDTANGVDGEVKDLWGKDDKRRPRTIIDQ